jgi:hypothetical protein
MQMDRVQRYQHAAAVERGMRENGESDELPQVHIRRPAKQVCRRSGARGFALVYSNRWAMLRGYA